MKFLCPYPISFHRSLSVKLTAHVRFVTHYFSLQSAVAASHQLRSNFSPLHLTCNCNGFTSITLSDEFNVVCSPRVIRWQF